MIHSNLLLRPSSWMALALAVVVPASLGCVTISSFYSPEDMTKPQADLSGVWVDDRGQLFTIHQSEKEASGRFSEWGEITGAVKGRVFIGEGPGTDVAFTLREDGLGGRLGHVWGLEVGQERRAYRLHLGPSTSHLSTKADPYLAGGLVCQLPGSEGSSRRVLVNLSYSYASDGHVIPIRAVVPLDGSGKPWFVGFPGDGIFGQTLGRGELTDARKGSVLHQKHPGTLEGKPCWWVMSAQWSAEARGPEPDYIVGEFYLQDPDTGVMPVETSGLLSRAPGQEWRAIEGKGYVLGASRITRARAILEGGVPVRVETMEVQAPLLEDFLVLQEPFVRLARWRNHALLDVKNKTLPKILAEYKTTDLSALVGRLEKLILDLNHESEVLRDRAQKAVERATLAAAELRENRREIGQIRSQLRDPELPPNEHYRLNARLRELETEVSRTTDSQSSSERTVDEMREMATVYKERVEVLKPFLPSIKDELANRAK